MKIKAVLFDLGNTLVYSRPEETFQKILEDHGIIKSIDQVKHAMIKGNQEFEVEKRYGLSAHEFYTQLNLLELKHLGITGAEAKKLAEQVDFQWFKYAKICLHPTVRKTLLKLKQLGFKLGIITRGYREDIEQILPKVGLETLFDICVGKDTAEKGKPHQEAFTYALKQLEVEPSEAIFVGDDFENDYLGAEKAGIIPVLIDREGSTVPDVRSIKRLDEIFGILQEINP